MLRDLCAAGRIANLPTVWTNIMVGATVALVTLPGLTTAGWVGQVLLAALAGSLLYIAGCFYNDYHDRHWDAEHKPDRAIPAGRLSAPWLLKLIVILGGLGTGLCLLLGTLAAAIAVWIICFIFIYTRLHKQTALAILPMGLCRAGLYLLGFASVLAPSDLSQITQLSAVLAPSMGLIAYIAGITLVARSEATNTLPPAAKWIGLALLMVPVYTHMVRSIDSVIPALTLIVVVAVGGEVAKGLVERSVGGFVSLCLAGICLIDGILLLRLTTLPTQTAPFHWGWSAGILVTGFISARLLQRYAPAT